MEYLGISNKFEEVDEKCRNNFYLLQKYIFVSNIDVSNQFMKKLAQIKINLPMNVLKIFQSSHLLRKIYFKVYFSFFHFNFFFSQGFLFKFKQIYLEQDQRSYSCLGHNLL